MRLGLAKWLKALLHSHCTPPIHSQPIVLMQIVRIMRERGRNREGERERERKRERGREKERERKRERGREKERERKREGERE